MEQRQKQDFAHSAFAALFEDFPATTGSAWEKAAKRDIEAKGLDYEETMFWQLSQGLQLGPYYTADDLRDRAQLRDSEASHNNLLFRSKRPWEIRKAIREKDPVKANAMAHKYLEGGADAVFFDPSHTALSRSHTYPREEAGLFSILLQNIDLKRHAVHFYGGWEPGTLLMRLKKALDENSYKSHNVHSCIDSDFFSAWIRQGSLPFPPQDLWPKLAQLIEFCQKELRSLRCLHVSSVIYQEAGADPMLESALLLASGHELLVGLQKQLPAPLFAKAVLPSLWFSVGSCREYFLEIARLRALRLLWPHIAAQYMEDAIPPMYIHSQSTLSNKSLYDSQNNILRSTTEAMAAAIGGADSISSLAFDLEQNEKHILAQELSYKTQLILRHEAYLDKVMDPAQGSYYIEKCTDLIARKVWELFQKIEARGGLLVLLQSGEIQKEIQELAQKQLAQVGRRKISVLGINEFPPAPQKDSLPSSPAANLKQKVRQDKPRYGHISTLPLVRLAQDFERLRRATEAYGSAQGEIPTVYPILLEKGAIAQQGSNFAGNFFGCAGYAIAAERQGLNLVDIAALSKEQGKHKIFTLCGAESLYAALIPKLIHTLPLSKKAMILTVAAHPAKLAKEGIESKHVFGFIYQGMPVWEELCRYQRYFGIGLD